MLNIKFNFIFLLCFTLPLVSSCTNNLPKTKLEKEIITTDYFILTSYKKISNPKLETVFYIEGDGRAWLSRYVISDNPTPKNHLVLKLADQDLRANIVYLARPCQYTPLKLNPNCKDKYWSSHRASNEVISSLNQAIDKLKTKNKKIHLVGYSGGGAIAVILAARRNDVASLLTFAANLNHEAVSQYHKTTPISASLNAIDFITNVKNIPQLHIVGTKDKIIPNFISQDFSAAVNNSTLKCSNYKILPNIEHSNGYLQEWHNILSMPINCAKSY